MSAYDATSWAEVCEAVSEHDEPPVRNCPQCQALCYEVPQGTYHCKRCGEVAGVVAERDGATLHVGAYTVTPVGREEAARQLGGPVLGYRVTGPELAATVEGGWTYPYQGDAIEAARVLARRLEVK